MKKVSVIIPAFCVEQYLGRAVESATHQTLSDIEIIIVDDGSTDATLALAQQFATQYPEITVIHQENKGSMAARITGLNEATGEYLLFLDADDWLAPEALETLYQTAKAKDADLVLYNGFWVSNNTATPFHLVCATEEDLNKDALGCFLAHHVATALWSKLIKRSYIEQHQIKFSDKISFGEDVVATGLLMMYQPRVAVCYQCLYFYDQREESLVHNVSETLIEINEAFDMLGQMLIENNIYEQYEKDYLELALSHINGAYQQVFSHQELKDKFEKRYIEWYKHYLEN